MKIIFVVALVLSVISTASHAETQLHITTGFTPPVSDFFKIVLAEADKRMPSISISFEVLPAERSLVLANQAITDGECCRIKAMVGLKYKNLLAVDHSFFSARFSAFAKKGRATVHSFAALKPYSVGSVEGWKIAVEKINEAKPKEVHIVSTPEQMFKMLEKDRIDYGVMGYLSGLDSISKLRTNNIVAIDPPLVDKPLHLFVHKKHKDLLPTINNTLKSMQDDGTFKRLYDQLLTSL